jgi:hypothetical protein
MIKEEELARLDATSHHISIYQEEWHIGQSRSFIGTLIWE